MGDAPTPLVSVPLASRPLYQPAPRDAGAGLDVAKKMLKIGQNARRAKSWTPDEKKAFLERVAESVTRAQSRFSSYSVQKRSELTAARWQMLVGEFLYECGVTSERVSTQKAWLASTLKEYAHFYLPFCLDVFRAKNDSYVTAKTLFSWFHSFVSVIARSCVDPQDGVLAGPTLLVMGGLHQTLANQVQELVVMKDLRRELRPIVILGIAELQLMIEEILKNTVSSKRGNGIVRIIELLLCFFTAARPSSISSANPRTTEEKKYPLLRHAHWVRECTGEFHYILMLELHNFKGYNQAVASMQKFTLTSPTLPQHVIFDLPSLMLYYYFLRGALPEEYRTWDDVLSSDKAEIRVRENMADKPMFVRCLPGTDKWTDEPRDAKSVSESISGAAENAGLPKGTAYGFRKGAAEEHFQLQGRDAARTILHHTTRRDVLTHHYLSGTDGLAPVELRLGTLGVTNPTFEAVTTKRALTSQAVYAILNRKDGDVDPDRDVVTNTRSNDVKLEPKERNKIYGDSARAQEAWDKFVQQWIGWRKFYNDDSCPPNMHKINRVVASGLRPEYNSGDPATAVAIAAALQSLREAAKDKNAANRQAVRPVKEQIKKEQRQGSSTSTTVAQRNAAVDASTKRSNLIDDLFTQLKEKRVDSPEKQVEASDSEESGDCGSDPNPDVDDDPARDMDDGTPGPTTEDVFAVIDVSDEQDSIIRDLWKHPGVEDGITRLNRIARVNPTVFMKKKIIQPAPLRIEPTNTNSVSHRDQEVYTLPSGDSKFPEVSMDDMRKEYINFVKRPIDFEQQIAEDYKANGNRWCCRQCKNFTHLPEKAAQSFMGRTNLVRHIKEVHSLWNDLEVAMIPKQLPANKSAMKFRCPSDDLDDASTVEEVRQHMLSACIDKHTYVKLYNKCEANRRLRSETDATPRSEKGKNKLVERGTGGPAKAVGQKGKTAKFKFKPSKPFDRIQPQERAKRADNLVHTAFSKGGGGLINFLAEHKVDASSLSNQYAALTDEVLGGPGDCGGLFTEWRYRDEACEETEFETDEQTESEDDFITVDDTDGE